MAVAGKVAITLSTENGGAWSADVTYDRLVAVKHNNNLYISRKTVANVEPPNDEFWFLALEGFGGDDVQTLIDRMNELSGLIQAIISGTQQVGNAKTLDGHEADDFVTRYQSLTTSILEKALEVGGGVHHFILSGGYTAEDLPSSVYRYGGATIVKRGATAITVIVWGCANTSQVHFLPKFNYYNGTWSGWKGLDDFLPLTGGTINGNTYVKQSGSASAQFGVGNDTNDVKFGISGDGFTYFQDKFGNFIIRKPDGTSTFEGTASGNLPLTGGTVNGAVTVEHTTGTPLTVKNTSADVCHQIFYGQSGYMGGLGFNGADRPVVRTKDNSVKDLLHTGNKPTGTYTGNGDATKRTINIGSSMPRSIIVTSSNGMVLMTYYGAIYKETSGTTVSGLSWGECALLDTGNIQLITTNPLLNASGVVYTYYSV